ncbi:(d)CMP kinase [Jatrophihabitans sp.]|uniref:(d)CMP kinase n=1 Tax=Jatrophihabitans sp. TaxID=1932789 RepID=UPI0030C71A43
MPEPTLSAAGTAPQLSGSEFSGVVALDGPSGTGKSTVARGLARRLGARYLDTGAMYRAATLAVLRAGIVPDADDAASALQITQTVEAARITISTDPDGVSVQLGGEPIDAEIRGGAVTAAVSAVAAVPAVRVMLVDAQRELIGDGGIVVEGRDIGSVVWPTARPKVYLTASAEARAARRAGELGKQSDLAAVAADIDRRDRLDSGRAASPLTQVDDAVELDTTHLNIDEVIDRLVDITIGVAPRTEHDDD